MGNNYYKMAHLIAREFMRVSGGVYPRLYEDDQRKFMRLQMGALKQAADRYGLAEPELSQFISWYYTNKTNETWLPWRAADLFNDQAITEWRTHD